jgi:hypothetical protein
MIHQVKPEGGIIFPFDELDEFALLQVRELQG